MDLKKIPAARILLIVIFGAMLFAGCASRSTTLTNGELNHSVVIDNVPFFAQNRYQCGPASLAGILNFFGDKVSPEEISDAIYRKDIRGTVSLDIVLFARKRGFHSRWYTGSIDDIHQTISAGIPLLVMVDKGVGFLKSYHFMVITGFSPDGIIVNSGKSRHQIIPNRLFLYQWEKTQFWSLLVSPEAPMEEQAG
ncbi:MAG: C39 family peptidase [Desulfobacterales bacterium]